MPFKDLSKQRESARKSARKHYEKNKEIFKLRHTAWREKLKNTVINHYSNGTMACVCCGETTPEFLTVDHINNNGTQERKMFTGGGHHNYRHIIKNNFPQGYQILCYNCNCGRARTKDKICPHKKHEKNSPQEEI